MAPAPAPSHARTGEEQLGFWNRFWFKPADPTIIGFMRITVGVLVIYTHIIYSFDLQEFFGKEAWHRLATVNARRYHQPWIFPANEWTTEDRDEDPYKPYENRNANRALNRFNYEEQGRQLKLIEPVMKWSEEERKLIDEMAFRKDQHTDLEAQYWFFINKYNMDPRSLLDKNEQPLPEKDRAEILSYALDHGVDPRKKDAEGVPLFSVWFHVTDPDWMAVVHVGILVIMILFTLGVATPITSKLTWLGAISYIHRAPTALFGQDTMMNILLIYLMVGYLWMEPANTALSLDRVFARWRARRLGLRFAETPQPQVMANVAYRLTQIHFCLIYAFAGTSKLQGTTWWNGTAVWWTLANYEFAPLNRQVYRNVLRFLTEHRWLWEIVMTGGNIHTLFVELCFPFLVWNRKMKWIMLTAATLLHAGIALFMGLTLFQIYMLCFLLPFYPAETMQRLVEAIRDTARTILPGRQMSAASEAPATAASGV
jgi:hypothetical protein